MSRGCVGFVTDEVPAPSIASVTPQMPSQYSSYHLQDGSWGAGLHGGLAHACHGQRSGLLTSCVLIGSGLYLATFIDGKQKDFHVTFHLVIDLSTL